MDVMTMTMTMTMPPLGTIEALPEQEDAHVVRRKVHIQWPSLAERLRAAALVAPCEVLVPGAGSLHLDGFRPSTSDPPGWVATGHLQWGGATFGRRVPVEVWIEPWSDETSHLQLLPHALLVRRWGIRRQRRYFELAHAAADQLLLVLR